MKVPSPACVGKTALIATLYLLVCLSPASAATRMPSFSLPDAVNGATIDSGEFDGKTLLVTFFATWCPPCMQEIPTLIKLQQQFSKDNFSVIGMSVDQGGKEVVAKLVANRSINYPVLMANELTARNFGGVVGIPTTFLVNRQGNVVKKYPGYVPYPILEKDIKQIIN